MALPMHHKEKRRPTPRGLGGGPPLGTKAAARRGLANEGACQAEPTGGDRGLGPTGLAEQREGRFYRTQWGERQLATGIRCIDPRSPSV